nr:hypothetical protein QOL21_02835 [Acholeplasma laidlawii]
MMLNVSGAFHSPYMKDAGTSLKLYAKNFKVQDAHKVLYANTTAKPLKKKMF